MIVTIIILLVIVLIIHIRWSWYVNKKLKKRLTRIDGDINSLNANIHQINANQHLLSQQLKLTERKLETGVSRKIRRIQMNNPDEKETRNQLNH